MCGNGLSQTCRLPEYSPPSVSCVQSVPALASRSVVPPLKSRTYGQRKINFAKTGQTWYYKHLANSDHKWYYKHLAKSGGRWYYKHLANTDHRWYYKHLAKSGAIST